jgi:hypothetical protein
MIAAAGAFFPLQTWRNWGIFKRHFWGELLRHQHPGRWPKGTSGNPGSESRAAEEARVDAIVAEWTRPYGGASNLPLCNVVLLKHAADLSLRRPRRADDQVRLSRLVAQAGLASCREQPLEPVEVEPEREYVPGEASAEIMRHRLRVRGWSPVVYRPASRSRPRSPRWLSLAAWPRAWWRLYRRLRCRSRPRLHRRAS